MNTIIFLCFLALGYIIGSHREKKHYREIEYREQQVRMAIRADKPKITNEFKAKMLVGEVVIAQDYFKGALSSLQTLFGGPLTAYEKLLDRSRREAVLRLHHKAQKEDAQEIINLRIETSRIGLFQVEALAYGTAIVPESRIENSKKQILSKAEEKKPKKIDLKK